MIAPKLNHLYTQLIRAWNERDASAFSNLFTEDSTCIGFDGSEMHGKDSILSDLAKIFKDHPTAKYVTIVREVKELAPNLGLLRAHAGMIQPGKDTIDSGKNAIQLLLAKVEREDARIIHFQNTPAQFHGRPELQEKLTRELQDQMQRV